MFAEISFTSVVWVVLFVFMASAVIVGVRSICAIPLEDKDATKTTPSGETKSVPP